MQASTKPDLKQEITNKIIAHIEQNLTSSESLWSNAEMSMPYNFQTKSNYRGINVPLLWMEAQTRGYEHGAWLGYRQAVALGGHVRKGERGTPIIRLVQIAEKDEKGAVETTEDGEAGRTFSRMVTHTVFNVAQIEGISLELPSVEQAQEFAPIEIAEQLLAASKASIQWAGTEAYYSPIQDYINMPSRNRFSCSENAYLVALHELTHWTAHESRLNRALSLRSRFKNADYAMEEMIAELGSAFLKSSIGLNGKMENHASYIKSWLTVLKNDKTAIFAAASKAQQAHDYIMKLATPSAQEALI